MNKVSKSEEVKVEGKTEEVKIEAVKAESEKLIEAMKNYGLK